MASIAGTFPNASRSFIDINPGLQNPEFERSLRDGTLAAKKGKTKSAGRYYLKYTSYRVRTLDPDNLAGGTKWLTDSLRYLGCIPDDTNEILSLEFEQKKAAHKKEEKTLIELWQIEPK